MVYKIEKDENGNVRNAKGERFMLSECRVAYTPNGVNYGYTAFESRSAALKHYNVEDIPESELFPQEGK